MNEAPENTLAALRSAEEAGSRVMLLSARSQSPFKKIASLPGDIKVLSRAQHHISELYLVVFQVMQMDILPTAEGTPVVFHDLNMKRATGLDADIRQVKSNSLVMQHHVPSAMDAWSCPRCV